MSTYKNKYKGQMASVGCLLGLISFLCSVLRVPPPGAAGGAELHCRGRAGTVGGRALPSLFLLPPLRLYLGKSLLGLHAFLLLARSGFFLVFLFLFSFFLLWRFLISFL